MSTETSGNFTIAQSRAQANYDAACATCEHYLETPADWLREACKAVGVEPPQPSDTVSCPCCDGTGIFRCFDGVDPANDAPGDSEPCSECGATGMVPRASDTVLLDTLNDEVMHLHNTADGWGGTSQDDDATDLPEGHAHLRDLARAILAERKAGGDHADQ